MEDKEGWTKPIRLCKGNHNSSNHNNRCIKIHKLMSVKIKKREVVVSILIL